MRLKALALQIGLPQNPGSYPTVGSEFPWSWTLEEYTEWYWRVKTWESTITLVGTYTYLGTPHAFSYTSTVTLAAIFPNYSDERERVKDSESFATNTGLPYGFWDNVPTNYLDIFHTPTGSSPDFPSDIRGYWTGVQGGAAGVVIPRFNYLFSRTFDSTEFTPNLPFTVDIDLRTSFEWIVGGTIFPLACTFNGKSTSLFLNDTSPPWAFSTCTIVVVPEEYFEFSNGVTPVWDSVTGAQLQDPLNS